MLHRYRKPNQISTRAPLAGSDNPKYWLGRQDLIFQPALPLRGATFLEFQGCGVCLFQPALPLRGATKSIDLSTSKEQISTRAPLAGSDRYIL